MAIILQTSSPAGNITLFLPLILIMVVFYFLMIMPAQKRQKKTTEMLKNLKNGDKVITNGGIYGTVSGIDGDSLILKISAEPPVKIRISRAAIAQVEASEDAK